MKRKRRPEPTILAPTADAITTGREHGDSYADVSAREPDFATTTGTHTRDIDRCAEEPSDAPLDAEERLEGN